MSFCTNCGAAQANGAAFCTGCGASQKPSVVSAPVPPVTAGTSFPAAAAYVPPSVPAGLPAIAQKQGHGLRTFVIIAVLFLIVLIGVGVAGALYAVRVAKEKAQALLKQVTPAAASTLGAPANTLGQAADTPTPLDGKVAPATIPPPSFAAWTAPAAQPAEGPAPLKAGMLVVTAIADIGGDYESMKQIQSIDKTGVKLTYSTTKHDRPNGQGEQISVTRTVLAKDLAEAHDYAEVFSRMDNESIPGSTAITTSREVFEELEKSGASDFSFRPQSVEAQIGALVSMFSAMAGSQSKEGNAQPFANQGKAQCRLQREGSGLYSFPVLLNEKPTTVPAMRATCTTNDGLADFYILDQPSYPLMLAWKLGSSSQLQVIKIAYPQQASAAPTAAAPSAIEEQLKEHRKAEIYGIYFDFASDHLKPESTPVLREIAGVLNSNRDWKLTVSGHTDNIGDDQYNLDLSKRRAAAVKAALVTEYHIAPDRLSTDGFGAGRPVATNETLAGRALNRRVELTRE